MYYIFKKNNLKNIVDKARKESGSFRKLSEKTGISKTSLGEYYLEKRIINKKNVMKLIKYAKIKPKTYTIIRKLPNNWRQIKGGKKCVEEKKKKGTFEKELKRNQLKGSKALVRWHKRMKRENIDDYYKMQYNRFRKISKYKFKTKKGEKVRNLLEKETADALHNRKIKYQYEPFIRVGNRGFFPDFLINKNIIIECTAWRGYDKAVKLKKKIRHLKRDYEIYIIIPKALNRFYKSLNNHIVYNIKDIIKTG